MNPDDTSSDADVLTADVIVIGGGPVGTNVAQYAIEDTDLTAILVERELVGGECSYWACIPSKAMLRPIAVADTAAHLQGVDAPSLTGQELLARRDEWVSHYDDSSQVDWAQGAGIQVVRGSARLTGELEVVVDRAADGPQRLRARRAVVLATGSEAAIPPPLSPARPWTSRDATGVKEVPGDLLIVGGGVVAVEAATWMAALGSRVTMLVRGRSLLSGYEPFAGEHVRESLEAAGVRIRFGTEVVSASRDEPTAAPAPAPGGADQSDVGRLHGGPVTATIHDADGEHELIGDELLAATGRRPRLGDLGLESLGLSADDVTGQGLPAWLHAVGDASGETPLTHWGKYRARVIGARIRASAMGEETEPVVDGAPSPQVVFTDPQVASVGMTQAQAREAGREIEVVQLPYASAAGVVLLRDDAGGTAQIVVDARDQVLLGATFVGPEAGEQIHAATIAIVGRVPVHVLRHAVPAFPAASELWLRLLEELPRRMRRG